MTRRDPRRRDRFRVNLTKAAGLCPPCPLARLPRLEGIFNSDPGWRKVTDVPGHDDRAMAQRRCSNHQIGAVATEPGRKSPPNARILGLKASSRSENSKTV